MGHLKDYKLKVNIGGNKSFLKSIMRREIHYELNKMRKYSKLPDINDHNLSFDPLQQKIIYNEIPIYIDKDSLESTTWEKKKASEEKNEGERWRP